MRVAQIAEATKESLSQAIVTRCFDEHPELPIRYGPKGREKCLQDTRFHLQYLFEAVASGSQSLFLDYVAWAKVMLQAVNVPEKDLAANLQAMQESLDKLAPFDGREAASRYIALAIAALPTMASDLPSFLRPDRPLYSVASRYLEYLLAGDRRSASRLIILDCLSEGISVRDIYLHVFQPVQHEIGRLWQTNRISVAQEHFCTAATQLVMSQLYPKIFNSEKNGHRMVATCVGSELHEIGVRMVADFFEMEGWDTFYVGANAPATSVIRTLVDKRIDLLAVSATMTFHLEAVDRLIRSVRGEPRLASVKILVGGYPFNVDESLWKKVGADGYGRDAEESERMARTLLQ